jgi:hypothetical protein
VVAPKSKKQTHHKDHDGRVLELGDAAEVGNVGAHQRELALGLCAGVLGVIIIIEQRARR